MVQPEPKPKRRKRGQNHPAVVIGSAIFTLLLFVGVGGGLAAWYGRQAFEGPGPLAAEKNVVVPRGQGLRDIADLLERQGVISNWVVFVIGHQMTHRGEPLQAGEYIFKPQVTMGSVLDAMTAGKVVQHQITLPEGLTSQQMVDRLNESDLLTGTIRVPQEGTLLPETYAVVRGQPRQDILKRMAADQQKLVADLWAKRAPDLPLKSPEEMVILASIVEKETSKADERPHVAAVFLNRLSKKMKLQSDPTIIYGIAGGKGSLGRPISRTDIVTPTPYNTYAIDGLPPGPIGNPGKASLAAVANPIKSKDLYFVADGTGGHVFAETLDQHNRNVARWREIEAEAKAKAAAQPAAAPAGTAPASAPPATSGGTGAAPATQDPGAAPPATPPTPATPRAGTAPAKPAN